MDVREALLKAAVKVFAEVGSRGATTRRIAQEADVNEVTLFRHFQSKDELMVAALQHFAQQAALTDLPEDPVDPAAELTVWCRDHFRELYKVRALIRKTMSEYEEHPERCAHGMNVVDSHRQFAERLRPGAAPKGTGVERVRRARRDVDADGRDLQRRDVPRPDARTLPLLDARRHRAVREVVPDGHRRARPDGRGGAVAFTPIEHAMRVHPSSRFVRRTIVAFATALLVAGSAANAFAQRRLTLDDALKQAVEKSAAVDVARAGESRADADIQRADSQRLPQLNFAGSYDRTLASEFSGAFESIGTPCAPLAVDPSRPLGDRVAEIERAATCGAFGAGGGLDFSNLPFGQRNVYRVTLNFAQAVYTGGRIKAQRTQAELGRQVATLATDAATAQVQLDVTRAFYDAALGDRLVASPKPARSRPKRRIEQARLNVEAGRQPEFEMLRAQVTRDNQRPVVIRRKADRDSRLPPAAPAARAAASDVVRRRRPISRARSWRRRRRSRRHSRPCADAAASIATARVRPKRSSRSGRPASPSRRRSASRA